MITKVRFGINLRSMYEYFNWIYIRRKTRNSSKLSYWMVDLHLHNKVILYDIYFHV